MLGIIATLTHNPFHYIFMGKVAMMQHNRKGAFSAYSSFDKSNRGTCSAGVPYDRTLLFSFKYFVWVKYW